MKGLTFFISLILILSSISLAQAQKISIEDYIPDVPNPAYKNGEGPLVLIDGAHNNYHKAGGRYKPFAELLRCDGYQVNSLDKPFSAEVLKDTAVLVIANALPKRKKEGSDKFPSVFTEEEIEALHEWVANGGSLFLIIDHIPFPWVASDLTRAFGVEFSNGHAFLGNKVQGQPDRFALKNGLKESIVTRGRAVDKDVTEVISFAGSAFKAPHNAVPILVFGPGSISIEPESPWKFNENTPRGSIEGWYQAAFMEVGRGRIVISGEAAMFTAQVQEIGADKIKTGMNSPYAKQNAQLLLNLMHWLSHASGMKQKTE